MISYSYWQRRFGGRPEVLGNDLYGAQGCVTVIGVTPRGFIGETAGQQPDFRLPLRMQPRRAARRQLAARRACRKR